MLQGGEAYTSSDFEHTCSWEPVDFPSFSDPTQRGGDFSDPRTQSFSSHAQQSKWKIEPHPEPNHTGTSRFVRIWTIWMQTIWQSRLIGSPMEITCRSLLLICPLNSKFAWIQGNLFGIPFFEWSGRYLYPSAAWPRYQTSRCCLLLCF